MSVKKPHEDNVSSKVAFVDLDSVNQIGNEAKKMGAIKVLLVTDRGLSKAGIARMVKRLVESVGVKVVPVYAPKPTCYVTNLADGIKMYRSNQCELAATETGVDIVIL
jgi:alcohol dehydrogenase